MVSQDFVLGADELEQILAHQDGLVLVTDAHGVIRYANKACEISSGRSRAELVGHILWEVTDAAADPVDAQRQYLALLEQGGEWKLESGWSEGCRPGRVVAWKRFVLSPRGDGGALVVSAGTDITELRDNERRWQWLSESTIEGITHHEKGVIVDVNRRCAEMFGFTVEEMVGQSVLTFAVPECHGVILSRIRQGLQGAYDVVGLRKDGSTFPLEIVTREVVVQGRPLRVAGLRDISERKASEERLVRAQRIESIGHLAGGIAHDFNNLLSVILGYSEALVEGTGLSVAQRTDLEQVIKAANTAGDLTRRLLMFARQEPVAAVALDANEAMARLEPLLRRSLKEDIGLEVELAPALWPVRISGVHFEQVLINLALNAGDAMPAGGTLRMVFSYVTVPQPRKLTSGELAPGPYLRIVCKDTGSGIEPQVMARVFEPFYSTKREQGHSGLGLAVVYGIVSAAGGSIEIVSTPGVGTEFSIYLPEAEQPLPQPVELELVPATPGVVLLVEDQEALLGLMARMLEFVGHRVLMAQSAEAALEVLERHSDEVDVLVTDVVMPGRSGMALAHQVRTHSRRVRVLFVSGYSDDVLPAEVLKTEQFLGKPFGINEFLTRVNRLIQSSKSDSPPASSEPGGRR